MNLLIFSSFLVAATASWSPDDQCAEIRYNEHPIITSVPEIVATVDNGIKMVVNGSKIQVVHVWGTPYEMGYA